MEPKLGTDEEHRMSWDLFGVWQRQEANNLIGWLGEKKTTL